MVRNFRSINGIEWKNIIPNEKNDWINQRDNLFESQLPLYPSTNFSLRNNSFFSSIGIGVSTNRDSWVYGFSAETTKHNVTNLISFYESQRKAIAEGKTTELSKDETKISWSANLKKAVLGNNAISFNPESFITAYYRPFCKVHLYYDRSVIERPGQWKNYFPKDSSENLIICFSDAKSPTVLLSDKVIDLHMVGDSHCFPLYWYEENKLKQTTLFDLGGDNDYIRHDGITDWILKEVRTRYNARNITKEMIFYYVYGLLHSPAYRERFAADLKKSLPRIPIVEDVNDFMDFYKYGKKLADLHLNYEKVEAYDGVRVIIDGKEQRKAGEEYGYPMAAEEQAPYGEDKLYEVQKMRFPVKGKKDTIIYNHRIHIENIPAEAYEYIVNGKSAIEWVMERYCVSQAPKSLIRNDANDWAREHNQPRYILDLLLSVINVSVQTVEIVNSLSKLKFD